jgi:hypothetical protein
MGRSMISGIYCDSRLWAYGIRSFLVGHHLFSLMGQLILENRLIEGTMIGMMTENDNPWSPQ